MHRLLLLLLLGFALPTVVVACGGEDERLGSASGDTSVTELLERVPDTASARRQVVYGSLARVRAAGGLAEPGDDVGQYFHDLQDVAPFGWVVAEPFRTAGLVGDFVAEVGFDLA